MLARISVRSSGPLSVSRLCCVPHPQGVTHVSRVVLYPEHPADPAPPPWVAHWAHPFEAEWVAREVPPPNKWPVLTLQVRSRRS
jgi:hypothetical protein